MSAERFSVTMDPDIGTAIREAAERAGTSVSAWIADAAAEKIRHQRLGEALGAWEAEDGPFTEEELAAAAELLYGSGRRRPHGSTA